MERKKSKFIVGIFLRIWICLVVLIFAHNEARATFVDRTGATTAVRTTLDTGSLNPDTLFRKLRTILSIDISGFKLNVSSTTGIRSVVTDSAVSLNEKIKEITGVDTIKFFSFLVGITEKVFQWLIGMFNV